MFRDPVPVIARVGCASALKAVIQRAVAWDPAERFTDARAFGGALRAASDCTAGRRSLRSRAVGRQRWRTTYHGEVNQHTAERDARTP